MEPLALQLDERLHSWAPETAARARVLIARAIASADQEALNPPSSRVAEQEVCDEVEQGVPPLGLDLVNFPFRTDKVTEIACAFLERAGGQIHGSKLLKLIYLLDRSSFARRCIPVVGGSYWSLSNGPATGEVLDLLHVGGGAEIGNSAWSCSIEDRANHGLGLLASPQQAATSDAEMDWVNELWAEHGAKDQWQLGEWCREHCPEWAVPKTGAAVISLRQIGEALGLPPVALRIMHDEALSSSFLATIFV